MLELIDCSAAGRGSPATSDGRPLRLALSQNLDERQRPCHEDWTEDDADGAKKGEAANDGEEYSQRVQPHLLADEKRIEQVVDRPDNEQAPGSEQRRRYANAAP